MSGVIEIKHEIYQKLEDLRDDVRNSNVKRAREDSIKLWILLTKLDDGLKGIE